MTTPNDAAAKPLEVRLTHRAERFVRDVSASVLKRVGTMHLLAPAHLHELREIALMAIREGCALGRMHELGLAREAGRRRRAWLPKVNVAPEALSLDDPQFDGEATTEPMGRTL